MTNDKLAIFGGSPAFSKILQSYQSIGIEEMEAVAKVMKSGNLSGYYGSWGEEFFGGNVVRVFEDAWSRYFKSKHSVAVNSNTSGLISAMGAIGVSPGDEVIVPPLSMAATAISPLFYGGIPVFCDLDPITCCIDPQQVRANITDK